MSQEIKIPVEAKVGGAVKGAEDLADAFSEVGAAVASIDASSRKAASGLDRMLDRLEEIKRAQESLQKIGINLSNSDAASFLGRWDTLRNARGPSTAGVRRFDSFQDWFQGHEGLYRSPREAARHRSAMIETALQGTDYRRQNGPTFDQGGGGGGSDEGGGGGGGAWGGGLSRARSSAMAFGKSMLALAGINSAMGMAGRALDNSTEEATGIDTLKRRMGDLGVSFEALRDQARNAGQGLGVTYVESQRLAQSYARTVGNLSIADASRIGGAVRLGAGTARGYGLDPEEGNQFFGSMAKYGVARDDQSQRRLALLIGDAVARSGYSGKVDELLGAITNYSALAARQTLTTPNVSAYANAITSLMSKGYAGLGPNEAGAMIGQADSAVRRGGAMGEASQNFIYAALRNASPGISPLQAMAMWQGGLFSTEANTFGQGPLKGMGPSKSNVTTFEKIVNSLKGRGAYKDPLYLASAMGGITGLDLAQSSALTKMATSGELGRSMSMLQSLGIDPSTISATGMPAIGKIANANHAGLADLYGAMSGRKDLSAVQRDILAKGAKGGDEDLRKAMLRVAATLDQEATKGTETRNSIAGLNDTLTKVGGDLLGPINSIRDGIVALAGQLVPGYVDVTTASRAVGASPYAASTAAKSVVAPGLMKAAMGYGLRPLEAAGLLGNAWAESKFDPKAVGDNGKAFGMFQMHADRWNPYVKWAKSMGYDPWTQLPQLQYAAQVELRGREGRAGAHFKMARGAEDSAAAGVLYERPKGYNALLENYTDAKGWGDRLAATQALYASVDVNIHHPDGKKEKVTVPLKAAVAAPKPAGTIAFSTSQDYR